MSCWSSCVVSSSKCLLSTGGGCCVVVSGRVIVFVGLSAELMLDCISLVMCDTCPGAVMLLSVNCPAGHCCKVGGFCWLIGVMLL